jgi:putative membrane protein
MVRFIIRMLISGAAVFGVAYFSNGSLLVVESLLAGVIFAVVLGLVNGVLRPIVQLLALPLSILTLGVVALLINLGFFYLAAALTPGVRTVGFWPSVLAALIVAFFNSMAAWITERGDE